MLDWDIQIVNGLVAPGNCFDKCIADSRRVKVHQANPCKSRYSFQFPDKGRQSVFQFQIPAVMCSILGDYIQFDHAGRDQFSRLGQYLLLRFASESTSDSRDGTERTEAIAALADSQVSPMTRSNQQSASIVRNSVTRRYACFGIQR